MMMSLLERLNQAFSGGIMFVQPTAETIDVKNIDLQIKNIKTCFFHFYKKHYTNHG